MALDYSAILEKHAGRIFRCAGVVGQIEAVRAGVGIGVLHDFAASPHGSALVRILPEVSFRQSYFLLAHPDTAHMRRIGMLRSFLSRRFHEERQRFIAH